MLIKRAVNLINNGMYGKAKRKLRKALEVSLSDKAKSFVYMYLGIIAAKEKDFKQAEKLFKIAIQYDRNNSLVYKNIAFLYKLMGRYKKAIEYLKLAGSLTNEISDKLLLVRMYIENNNTSKAIKELLEILEKDPNNIEAHLLIGKAYRKEMNIRKAIFHYKRVIELSNDGIYKAIAYKKLGDIKAEMKDYEQALFFYHKSLDISPDDAKLLYAIANVYIAIGKKEKAIPYLKNAFSLSYNKGFIVLIGDKAFSVGALNLALSSYKKAWSMDKKDRQISIKIAKISLKKSS
jgi:tetratricopeptide (TPR) repeat protein